MGGDDETPVHEKGIELEGAWIDGDLDLKACHCTAPLGLHRSNVKGDVVVRDAHLSTLSLQGSWIGGLKGDGVHTNGAILLRNGFKATGKVRLHRPQIGGDLDCSNGAFEPHQGHALSCDGAVIASTLFFRDVASFKGELSFAGCSAHHIADEARSWSKPRGLVLDGFQYDRIIDGPTDAATRIAWLRHPMPAAVTNKAFWAQPWEQLIKVLREMGHDKEAKAVAIAKQEAMRATGRQW